MSKYHVSGSDIYRGDEVIASVQDGKVIPLPGWEKYHIQASRAWNAHTPEVEEKIVVADAQPAHVSAEAEDNRIPPMPPIDPLLGTKTPAVARWYAQHKPDLWAKMHVGWANKPFVS
jgi:hypothetical protein